MVSKTAAKIGKLGMQNPAYWRNLGQKTHFPKTLNKKMLILTKGYTPLNFERVLPPKIGHGATAPLVDKDKRPCAIS